ncbi:hypothetical protein C0Q70_05263 [Pomacea canaliculata]|uniref:Uncharacterized protein n=1 Tax=Pomacea canaliculata TaxID=400727 RepID=A0A2T7PKP9_POMCA|nr:hypothetical protein C0Q70_05263 [Pomacea canaliculata]
MSIITYTWASTALTPPLPDSQAHIKEDWMDEEEKGGDSKQSAVLVSTASLLRVGRECTGHHVTQCLLLFLAWPAKPVHPAPARATCYPHKDR